MRVLQLLPTIAMGDAVSNDTLAIHAVLQEMGFQTAIYAENIDQRLPMGTAKALSKLPKLQKTDVVLYHMSTGSSISVLLPTLPCRKGMIYHNITPPHFMRPYHPRLTALLEEGLQQVKALADVVDFCFADSAFNAQNLREMGYQCPIEVRPILIPFSDYEKAPSTEVVQRCRADGLQNFVFVGRIAPNKKQEDLLQLFSCYQRHCNPDSRLLLVGSWDGMEAYYHRLVRYAAGLEVQNVVFTGHIPFAEILAYYHTADLFVCMSEHEGFCVPLVEAMYFDVPILAYAACAVSDTLGGSGFLLRDKNPVEAAFAAQRILTDAALRQALLEGQRQRLQDFSYAAVKQRLVELFRTFLI